MGYYTGLLYAKHWAKHFIHIYVLLIQLIIQSSCEISTYHSHFTEAEQAQKH